jgi:mRNA interferase MazF
VAVVKPGVARRFDVHLVALDSTLGSEMRKTRPCVVVSPDKMNQHIRTVLIALLTSKGTAYPTRVASRFGGRAGQAVLDRLRVVDVQRLTKRLARLSASTQAAVLTALGELFAP